MGEADRGYSREPGGEQRTCQSEKWGRSLKGTEGSTVARIKPVKVFVVFEKEKKIFVSYQMENSEKKDLAKACHEVLA